MNTRSSIYDSNSESEGMDFYLLKKTSINEPPSPDLKRKAKNANKSHASKMGDNNFLPKDGGQHRHDNNRATDRDMKTMSSNFNGEGNGRSAARQEEEGMHFKRGEQDVVRLPGDRDNRWIPGERNKERNFLDIDSKLIPVEAGYRGRQTLGRSDGHAKENVMGANAGHPKMPSINLAHPKLNFGHMVAPKIKQEPEEASPSLQRRNSRQFRSSSRSSPSHVNSNTSSSAAKKLSNFKAAEKAGRTICVCGASAYYERERFALMKEKTKLKEEQQSLREEGKRIMENHRKVKEEIFELEKQRTELECKGRSLQRAKEMQDEEASALEQSKRQLQKLKDQIEKDKDALQRTQQDLLIKGEEYSSRKAHLERLQQDLRHKKSELEDRSIQIRKQAAKNESVEAALETESNKLAALSSELSLESERLKERSAVLHENEVRYEEKRRTLQNLESRLNHEVSMNEEKIKYLENKESELQSKLHEAEEKDRDLTNASRDLEKQRQELAKLKSEFEFQRQRELESIENEKKAAALEIQLSKEDCAAFIQLEKEWIVQEKENLTKQKEDVQRELQIEKEHVQQMNAQMRKRNSEIIEEEREEWNREQVRAQEMRSRHKIEMESLRQHLDTREFELNSLKDSINADRDQLHRDRVAFESMKDLEFQKLETEKNELLNLGHQIRRDKQALQHFEAQIKAKSSSLDSREGRIESKENEIQEKWLTAEKAQNQVDMRYRELDEQLRELNSIRNELNTRESDLNFREKRLKDSEAQATWIKEIYSELQEKKQMLQAQEKRLEIEKIAIAGQRQSLLVSRPHAAVSASGTTKRPTPNRVPLRSRSHCRRFSATGLPVLQTVFPQAKKQTPIINVPSDSDLDGQPRYTASAASSRYRAASVPTYEEPSWDCAFEQGDCRFLESVRTTGDGSPQHGPADDSHKTQGGAGQASRPFTSKDSISSAKLGQNSFIAGGDPDMRPDDISLSSHEDAILRRFGDGSSFELHRPLSTYTGGCLVSYDGGETETETEPVQPDYCLSSPSGTREFREIPEVDIFRSATSNNEETRQEKPSLEECHREVLRGDALQRERTPSSSNTRPSARRMRVPGLTGGPGNETSAPISELKVSGNSARIVQNEARLSSREISSPGCGTRSSFAKPVALEKLVRGSTGRDSAFCHSQETASARETARSSQYHRSPTKECESASFPKSSGYLMRTPSPSPNVESGGDLDSSRSSLEDPPSLDGSIPTCADPSLSAPTIPHGWQIDFNTSVGPSLTESLLGEVTQEVRQLIQTTHSLAYGRRSQESTRQRFDNRSADMPRRDTETERRETENSRQNAASAHRDTETARRDIEKTKRSTEMTRRDAETAQYLAINRSLDLLGSDSVQNRLDETNGDDPNRNRFDDSNQQCCKSVNTSEKTTAVARENEVPINSWVDQQSSL